MYNLSIGKRTFIVVFCIDELSAVRVRLMYIESGLETRTQFKILPRRGYFDIQIG